MRTIVLGLATALLFGGAGVGCKKRESEKAGSELKKAQEKVEERREEVRDEQKDVVKEQRDVTAKRAELSEAEANLAAKRSQFEATVNEKLARIDSKIAMLDSRVTPTSDTKIKDKLAGYKTRRKEITAKLDLTRERTAANWDDFTKEVGDNVDKLEKDLDDELK